jgi:hypothetical protein
MSPPSSGLNARNKHEEGNNNRSICYVVRVNRDKVTLTRAKKIVVSESCADIKAM